MSSTPPYERLITCINSNDYGCVVEVLTTTNYGKLILDELTKAGVSQDDVVSAILLGDLLYLAKARDLTVDVIASVSKLSSMIMSGKYLDALAYVVSNPDVVKQLNAIQGTNYSLEDFITSLAYNALRSGSGLEEVSKLVSGHGNVYSRLVSYYLSENVSALLKEGKHSEALELIEKHLNTVVSGGYADIARTLLMSVYGDAVEKGRDDVALRALNTLSSIDKNVGDAIKATVDDAKALADALSAEVLNSLTNEVNEALRSEDHRVVEGVAEKWKELLTASPLIINGVDTGLNMYQYLKLIAKYLRDVKPLMDSVYEKLTNANEKLRSGQVVEAQRNAEDASRMLESLEKDLNTIIAVAGINSLSQGRSQEEARENTLKMIESYKNAVRYIEAVSVLQQMYDQESMNVLRSIANIDKSVAETYALFTIKYLFRSDDLIALFSKSSTPVIDDLKSLGISQTDLLKNKDLIKLAVIKSVNDELRAGNTTKAKNLSVLSISNGIDGEISKFVSMITSLEAISESSAKVASLINEMSNAVQNGTANSSWIESKVNEVRAWIKRIEGASASPSLRDVKTADGKPLTDAVRDYVSSVNDYLKLMETMSVASRAVETYNKLVNDYRDGKIDGRKLLESVNSSVLPQLADAVSNLHGVKIAGAEQFSSKLRSLTSDINAISIAVSVADDVKTYESNLLKMLADGLQVEEAGKAGIEWANILRSVKVLDSLVVVASVDESRNFIRSLRSDLLKHLTELKNWLVSTDVRLEDVFNKSESDVGLSVPYEKPYYEQFPVEKYIKIGIAQVSDWLKRVPLAGQYISSFWSGLSQALMSLAMPYTMVQQVKYIVDGAREFTNRLQKLDLLGAVRVVFEPVIKAFAEDPAQAVGTLVGALVLASVGSALVKKFRLPTSTRELVINVLQGDPIGLGIAYVVSPATKLVSRLIKSLVTNVSQYTEISPVLRRVDMSVFDNTAEKVSKTSTSVRKLADYVKTFSKNLENVVSVLEEAISGKGVAFVRSVRDRILNAITTAYSDVQKLSTYLKEFSEMSSPELARRVSLIVGEPEPIVKSVSRLMELVDRVRNLGIEITYEKLVSKSLKDLEAAKTKLASVASDIRDTTDKVYKSVKSVVDELKKDPNMADKLRRIEDALHDYRLDNPSAIYRVLEEMRDLLKNMDPEDARTTVKNLLDRLSGEGVLGKLKTLELSVTGLLKDINSFTDSVIDLVKKSVSGRIEKIAELAERIPELKGVVEKIEVSGYKPSAVVKAFEELSARIDEVVSATKKLDYLNASVFAVELLKESVDDLLRALKDLGLDKYDYYSKIMSELSRISDGLENLYSKVRKISSEVSRLDLTKEAVSDFLRKHGMADLANELAQALTEEQVANVLRKATVRIGSMTIDSVLKSLSDLSDVLSKISPELTAVRMAVMNSFKEIAGVLPESRVPATVVNTLKEVLEKYGAGLPNDVRSAIEKAINEPTLDRVVRVVNMFAYDPVLASKVDISLLKNVASELLTHFRIASGIDVAEVKKIASGLSETYRVLDDLSRELSVKAGVGLVSQPLIRSVSEALEGLKKHYPMMSGLIDEWRNTLTEFLEKLRVGDVAGASAMAGKVSTISKLLKALALPPSIYEKIKSAFTDLINRIKGVPETEETVAIRKLSDAIAKDLAGYGAVELGGYGYIASSIEEVVGFGIKTSADLVPSVRRLFEEGSARFTARVGDLEVSVTREAVILPYEVRLTYVFELPSGGKAYYDVVVRPIRYNPTTREVVNAIYTHIYYDPILETDQSVRALIKSALSGELLESVDKTAYDILRRVAVVTDIGDVSLGDVLRNALKMLGTTLYVAMNIVKPGAVPEELTKVYRLYEQSVLTTALSRLKDLTVSLPDELSKQLSGLGIVPYAWIPDYKLVVGDFIDVKVDISRLAVINIPEVGKVLALVVPTSVGDVYVVPKPVSVPEQKTLEEVIEEIKKEIPEVTVTEVTLQPIKEVTIPEMPREEEKGIEFITPAPPEQAQVPFEVVAGAPKPLTPLPKAVTPTVPTRVREGMKGITLVIGGGGRTSLEKLQI